MRLTQINDEYTIIKYYINSGTKEGICVQEEIRSEPAIHLFENSIILEMIQIPCTNL